MRKNCLLAIILFLCSSSFAQEPKESKTRYYRHEINISRTGMIMPKKQWDDYEDRVYRALVYEREHDEGFGIGLGTSSDGTLISYYYHLNSRIAFGGMAAFTSYDNSLSDGYIVPVQIPEGYWDRGEQAYVGGNRTEYTRQYISSGGKMKEKSFFLMPSLKWSWLNNSWCSLYMKASAGLHFQKLTTEKGDIPLKDNRENLDESKLWLAYVATPFGWEVGKQKVRAFFEFGFGSNTNLQIGLTYRFGRYTPSTARRW